MVTFRGFDVRKKGPALLAGAGLNWLPDDYFTLSACYVLVTNRLATEALDF